MSSKFDKTIIFKEANFFADNGYDQAISYAEDDTGLGEGFDITEFKEELEDESDEVVFEEDLTKLDSQDLEDMTLGDALEPVVEELEEVHEEGEKLVSEYGEMPLSQLIPGSDKEVEKEDADEVRDTDYAHDGDLSKFMDHISALYPAKIPRHDGTSTVGCERAISFLDRMNGDISRAIRDDHENILDIEKLEEVRVNIMRDVLVLKDHLGKLKKNIKNTHTEEKQSLASTGVPDWESPSGKVVPYSELKEGADISKQASTPNNIVIAVSPFERAISGMMINAHVSSGHPMEEVYASLKKKYDLTDREELSIMQLCMDSGFHIFKDRGSYSEESTGDGEKRGIDFVRNYFA